MITQRNTHYKSSYSNLKELVDLIFPHITGNNRLTYSDFSYFKPRLTTRINVNDLFK